MMCYGPERSLLVFQFWITFLFLKNCVWPLILNSLVYILDAFQMGASYQKTCYLQETQLWLFQFLNYRPLSKICVMAIFPKMIRIYLRNLTNGCIILRRCATNKKDHSSYFGWLNYLPLSKIPLQVVRNICLKLHKWVHHIEMMCHEQERSLWSFWLLKCLPLSKICVRAITPR